MNPYISIIIPAYNEGKRIGNSIEKAIAYLESQKFSFEIIVVDDGSSDDTFKIATGFSPHVRAFALENNMGKGAAVRYGMLESTGDFRIFTDADFSTPINELEKLLKELEQGSDIVIGSRALDYSMIKKHQPFYREFMGKFFNKIVQLTVFKGIKDTQCGFKGFTARSAGDIFAQAKINGFGFDVEILYIAIQKGYSIKQVPVIWYNDTRSRVNPVKDSWGMLTELFRIKKIHKGIKADKSRWQKKQNT